MYEQNVKLVRSTGGECFWCDKELKIGALAMNFQFKIPLVITSANVNREMHFECAKRFRDHLGREIEKGSRI